MSNFHLHPDLHRKIVQDHHDVLRRSARDSRLHRQVRADRRQRRRAGPGR